VDQEPDVASELAHAVLKSLQAHRRRIDDLNVYPVPDGDTGTNLTLTVRAVVDALDGSQATARGDIAKEVTRAALLGARGNSGVILSQIVRGAGDALGRTESIGGAELAEALRSASDAAYRAVPQPVEGTMLTVIREMAEEAEGLDARASEVDELLRRVVERGERAVEGTPELLGVLKQAGVVDAGGAGLLEIVRGVAAGVTGEPLPVAPVEGEHLRLYAIHQELSRYRYCTTFVVEGEDLDAASLEQELAALGDSMLVVGDSSALKVHIHTDEPGAALALATSVGVIEGVEVANMHRQTLAREARLAASPTAGGAFASLPTLETGLVVVAPGSGNRRLFERAGATSVIEGGQTMNPSTADLLDAIEATPATEVLVLPNNRNVILSAEQAVEHATKRARVVPTTSVPAGLAAALRFIPSFDADTNEASMREALESVATGEVARASRDVELDGVTVRKGAWLGLANGAAASSGDDFEQVAEAVIESLLDGERETLTLLTGADEPELEGLLERVRERHPDVEVEVHAGGQPHYPLLLSAE
jgi:fatty acid kinase